MFLIPNIDTIADNIAGNNADNKVDMSDSDIYNIARSCRLDPHTGICLNPMRASNLTFMAVPEPTKLLVTLWLLLKRS